MTSISAFRNSAGFVVVWRSLAQAVKQWILAMACPPAPLRKIAIRELVVTQPDLRQKYFIYCLMDTLECGHSQEVYLYDGIRDLLNGYTTNPAVKAKRHRCRPCASLLLSRKPVQSVAIGKPAVAA